MAENVTNNKIITTVQLDVAAATQEIVKLNSLASDGTQKLSARLDAKNKQIEIQNSLNKKAISDLEKQIKGLTGVEGKEKDLAKATAQLEKAKLSEVKVTESNEKAQRKLSKAYDGSKGAMNKLDNATGGFITRLKVLAANPIVLAITLVTGALMLLKEAFTSSEEGQNKWAKAMAMGSAILGNLLDVVADVAEYLVDAFTNPRQAIEDFANIIKTNITNRFEGLMELIPQLGEAISLLFEGKFSQAGKVAGNAMAKVTLGVDDLSGKIEKAADATKKFIKEQEREAKLAGQVADMRAKADLVERKLIVDRSKSEAKIAQLRLDAKKEEEFTDKQRKQFLLEAATLQDNLIDAETKYLVLRRDAQILENTFSRSNKENLTAEAEAIAAVNNQIGTRAVKAKKLQTELNSINNKISADSRKAEADKAKAAADKVKADQKIIDDKKAVSDKEAADKAAEDLKNFNAQLELDTIELERQRSLGENVLALELELLERKRNQDVSFAELTSKEIELINKKAANAKEKLEKNAEKTSKDTDKAMLDSGINMAADAFGIAQEVSLAKMLMNAPEAIGNVWTQAANQPTIPQIILHGAVGLATTLGPIIKGISTIKNTKFSKKKGGAPSGSASMPSVSGATAAGVSAISDVSANNASRVGTDTSLSNKATSAALNNSSVGGGGAGKVVFSESAYTSFQSQVKFKEDKSTI